MAIGSRGSSIPDPGGVVYDYGTAGLADDNLNRPAAIQDAVRPDTIATYQYLGLGTIVTEDYEEPQVKLDYTGTDHSYSGLDRFNRVVDQIWEQYQLDDGNEVVNGVLDGYKYGYDQFGNVAWKEYITADNQTDHPGQLYTYDSVGQLTSVTSGSLNSAARWPCPGHAVRHPELEP